MLIENAFELDAGPDRVFAFLSDAHNVVTCFPGAELVEDLGDDSYRGKVKIKVGPVTAAFTGTATIVERDEAGRVAVLRAEGKDTKGTGTAKATAEMRVTPVAGGSAVSLATELIISGKLAQFGRGIMSDVATRMVGELASRVRAQLSQPAATGVATVTAPTAVAVDTAPAAVEAAPISAGSILRTVVAGWLRRLAARFRRH
ncbi:carbon monoxide dehydrogenase subunit G [Amycolatopsis acidiphila]|nr:carbon monoxide dehydrogenase subunit G [Amycolatopsis acidiphila]